MGSGSHTEVFEKFASSKLITGDSFLKIKVLNLPLKITLKMASEHQEIITSYNPYIRQLMIK